MEPNLFKYGTGELTHDAILSYILDWGNHKESNLYNLANEFVELLTGEKITIGEIEISQQYKCIDILAKLNENKIIVIEDKIDTSEHSDQLNNYKRIAKEDFKDKDIYYAYVTVGDECDYNYILEKGYKVIERKDLIRTLKNYLGISDIIDNYYNYLYEIEEDYNSYKSTNLNEWTPRGWQGFYKELNKRFPDGSWDYVSNPRGGFLAFYWDFYDLKYKGKINYTIYLQIEENRIAFKVGVKDDEYKSEIRNYVWDTLKLLIDYDTKVKKTNFAKGRSMTFAEIKNYSNKNELYNSIRLAENIHRKLKVNLHEKMVGTFGLMNPKDWSYSCEDMFIIDGIIPNEKIKSNMILITNVKYNEMEDFLKSNTSKVFIFIDRESLDEFKNSLLESKRYLDEDSNAHELINFYSSDSNNIKTLKHVDGIENIKKTENAILFINKNNIKKLNDYLLSDGFYPYIIRDEESLKGIEGFFIINKKSTTSLYTNK